MPWTFSHPAAVFPLKNLPGGRLLNLPALIMGSLSPDFFYSVGLYDIATTAHHLPGWFYTAFPLCLLIFLIVHLLSYPLSVLFPIPFVRYEKQGYKDRVVFALSLFIGAVTHIVWDAFTHDKGFFVELIPLLQFRVFHSITNEQGISIYKILQHLSSLLGLLYLTIKYWRYQKKLEPIIQKKNKRKLYHLIIIGFISGFLTCPVALFLSWEVSGINISRFIFKELTLSVSVFFIILVFIALWIRHSSSKTKFAQ
ncbi:hypothetical protein B5C26_09045 [Photorhabdus luminescens]|uniref:DUF4184 family protein n=1 Tax=Photorhabdus luminescens TaxID=29488 RepID=UPI000B4DA890|nr:DUF4184 family protein [Photorhabdus luminescens]OWO82519.1 hypothetical protein B5C26_09045 [Photorhabdus luminescens]